jgi:tryptophan synthase alpha subunit
MADGIIVGSAFVNALGKRGVEGGAELIATLRGAMQSA